jgi:hypothetical protein
MSFVGTAGFWAVVGSIGGAIVGFSGTYVLQRIADNRRKKKLRTVARNIIGIEIIHNLEVLTLIEENVQKTIESTGKLYTYSQPPRVEIFNNIFNLSSLSVLEKTEQLFFIHVFSTLNIVLREYALWPDKMLRLTRDSSEHKRRESQWLLNAVAALGSDLINLLGKVCLNEKEGLQREELLTIYQKIKQFNTKQMYNKYALSLRSSDHKLSEKKFENCEYLIVWVHDYLECPLKVIELRPSDN